jgi:hypothetical protein
MTVANEQKLLIKRLVHSVLDDKTATVQELATEIRQFELSFTLSATETLLLHQLLHFVTDADIRARDEKYDGMSRAELEKMSENL